ncbi:hypothetical protein BU26DRAFT_109847 [Trematosphaeria pertusa]|uniref:Uncharacterized protein n=1 Tax=Trematosphaeria pertusa TaxID=390896 RepID=A0A6A6I0I9_9PLEO|nr:uncharacterized protein BU26DRAFT_109847 [Trematosphaeria pertusa]KAF2243831.1 hypothetical protein BU26DRAFT_109847 [Trematosphaeria pertusa]
MENQRQRFEKEEEERLPGKKSRGTTFINAPAQASFAGPPTAAAPKLLPAASATCIIRAGHRHMPDTVSHPWATQSICFAATIPDARPAASKLRTPPSLSPRLQPYLHLLDSLGPDQPDRRASSCGLKGSTVYFAERQNGTNRGLQYFVADRVSSLRAQRLSRTSLPLPCSRRFRARRPYPGCASHSHLFSGAAMATEGIMPQRQADSNVLAACFCQQFLPLLLLPLSDSDKAAIPEPRALFNAQHPPETLTVRAPSPNRNTILRDLISSHMSC